MDDRDAPSVVGPAGVLSEKERLLARLEEATLAAAQMEAAAAVMSDVFTKISQYVSMMDHNDEEAEKRTRH